LIRGNTEESSLAAAVAAATATDKIPADQKDEENVQPVFRTRLCL